MGRKAKLKKIRQEKKQSLSESQRIPKADSNQFIQELERQGYQLKRIERSPEIPEKRREPEV